MKKISNIIFVIGLFHVCNVSAGEWFYTKNVDEFLDTETHVALVNSLIGDGYGIARCEGNTEFNLIFSVGKFIGTNDSYSVRYRIDKQNPVSSIWGVSTEGTSIFVKNRDKNQLARQMLSGNSLLLEVMDYKGTPHKIKLSLNGSKNAIGKVMDACNIERIEILGEAKKDKQKQVTNAARDAIQQKIIERWIKPISTAKGLSCTIRVKLLPSGDVMNAQVIRGSGDRIFDRSAENAVRKSSPLPVPNNETLFAKNFRLFIFTFKPEK